MFGVLSLTQISHSGLAGKERLKTLALKVIEEGNSRDVCVTLTAGFMLFLTEDTRNVMCQL
ncbi:hypothetical protein HMPREF9348_03020 [Escherichia coli MS 145-7]|nr:hypothetical protein HMPREF9348_03020 [Escherichia coli MS 145-7]